MAVNVVYTGEGGTRTAEAKTVVVIPYFKHPAKAAAAIKRAAMQRQQAQFAAPAQEPPPQHSPPGPLQLRLGNLRQLVKRGVLTQAESDSVQGAVLEADVDLPALLLEAASLADQSLITAVELAGIKQKWLQKGGATGSS